MFKRMALAGGLALTGYEVYSHLTAPQLQVPDAATTACSEQVHAAVLACAADPAAFNARVTKEPEALANCLKENAVVTPLFNCSKPDSYAPAHLYIGSVHDR